MTPIKRGTAFRLGLRHPSAYRQRWVLGVDYATPWLPSMGAVWAIPQPPRVTSFATKMQFQVTQAHDEALRFLKAIPPPQNP